jgi:acetoacetate decarboxylase
MPFSGTTWQPREDGTSVVASLTGSARSFPVKGEWEFDADGPLGWLAGISPFASFAMRDFAMTFG